ncbi:uncharacterized protein J3R85_016133 [Psidium guajava]|nr:uncharacterized protein J3R85_016133 [Psidium guajava]
MYVWAVVARHRSLMVREHLRHAFLQLDILEGNGSVGTVIKLLLTGVATSLSYKEKFTRVDDENRVKEVKVIKGGFLDMESSFYRVQLEVISKDEKESCVIKSTVKYEVADDASVEFSIVSGKPLAAMAEVAKKLVTTSASTN